MSTLLIYGATGYTGRMAAERAKALGLQFEIAERSQRRLATQRWVWRLKRLP